MSFYVSTGTFVLLHCDEWDRVVALLRHKFVTELHYCSYVAPNNGDHHFSKLFNVEETKGIIHCRIYPASDVVQPVWYNISALIRCNFIIKNYVNRKITSYIYLLIFTISLWLHVKHFIALTKR